MALQLAIVEEIVGHPERQSFQLKLVSERIVAREIVTSHVRAEVERQNDDLIRNRRDYQRVASILVGSHSHPIERALNGRTTRKPKLFDPEAEIESALAGIESNQIIMLFDDAQVEDLDQELTVTENSRVTFLRMVPLVGG